MTEVINSSVIEFGLIENSNSFWIQMGERHVVASREEAGHRDPLSD